MIWTDKWGQRHDIANIDADYAERILVHLIRTAPQRELRRRQDNNPFRVLPQSLVDDPEFSDVAVRRILRSPEAKAVMRRLAEFEPTEA